MEDEEEPVAVTRLVDVLPLSDDARLAAEDRRAKPQRLVLSGRPVTAPVGATYLKAKYQIGAATGPLDFGRQQSAFHRDDIPPQKLKNAEAVAAWKKERSNKCGVAPRWNQSVLKPDILCQNRTRENADHDRSHMYQYNFRAEVLPPKNLLHVPPPSKWGVTTVHPAAAKATAEAKAASRLYGGVYMRTMEAPVHPKLEGKAQWRPESRATRAETAAHVTREAARAKQASSRARAALDESGRYLAPEAQYAQFRSQVRVLKSAGFTKGYAASLEAQESIPKHNRLAAEPSLKERSFAHSGNFGYNKVDDMWMWSDTGSYDPKGIGDVATIRDPQAYNLTGPNN